MTVINTNTNNNIMQEEEEEGDKKTKMMKMTPRYDQLCEDELKIIFSFSCDTPKQLLKLMLLNRQWYSILFKNNNNYNTTFYLYQMMKNNSINLYGFDWINDLTENCNVGDLADEGLMEDCLKEDLIDLDSLERDERDELIIWKKNIWQKWTISVDLESLSKENSSSSSSGNTISLFTVKHSSNLISPEMTLLDLISLHRLLKLLIQTSVKLELQSVRNYNSEGADYVVSFIMKWNPNDDLITTSSSFFDKVAWDLPRNDLVMEPMEDNKQDQDEEEEEMRENERTHRSILNQLKALACGPVYDAQYGNEVSCVFPKFWVMLSKDKQYCYGHTSTTTWT